METNNPYPLPEYGYAGLFTKEHRDMISGIYPAPAPGQVLITAGGTQEPIDDVRYVGNFSAGRFGHALAEEYASHGHNVTLLAPNSVTERFGVPEHVKHIPYTSAESLRMAMIGTHAADLILHAAAVADYRPIKIDGKISSDQESLVIEMERTPKILPLIRNHFGNETTIAGFKLLSGASTEYLVDTGKKQIDHCDTDYCVANLLDDINDKKGERTVHLISTDEQVKVLTGKTSDVARGLYLAIKWNPRARK